MSTPVLACATRLYRCGENSGENLPSGDKKFLKQQLGGTDALFTCDFCPKAFCSGNSSLLHPRVGAFKTALCKPQHCAEPGRRALTRIDDKSKS